MTKQEQLEKAIVNLSWVFPWEKSIPEARTKKLDKRDIYISREQILQTSALDAVKFKIFWGL